MAVTNRVGRLGKAVVVIGWCKGEILRCTYVDVGT